MYQEFFQLKTLPFSLTPNSKFFCKLKGHQEALNTLEFCIQSGEGFIKIIGEVGSGKTLLCRKLLETLSDNFIPVYIPNPDLAPVEIRKAFAQELGLNRTHWDGQHELLNAIHQNLVEFHSKGKKVILIIDEAQALPDASLETIRLLTNLETAQTKLLQVVLFAQPELNLRLDQENFRQLKQRITFSYTLPLMSRDELDVYIYHRLAVAGHTHSNLFTRKARKLLFRASKGIPRIANILSHKAMLVAYGLGVHQVDHKAVRRAVKDTESIDNVILERITHVAISVVTSLLTLTLSAYILGIL